MCDSCVDHNVDITAKCDEIIIMRFGITHVTHMSTFIKHHVISYNTCNTKTSSTQTHKTRFQCSSDQFPTFLVNCSQPPGFFFLFRLPAGCDWIVRLVSLTCSTLHTDSSSSTNSTPSDLLVFASWSDQWERSLGFLTFFFFFFD